MSLSVSLIALPADEGATLAFVFRGLAEKSGGRVSVETIARDIASGDLTAWTVWDGQQSLAWVLTQVYTAPTGLKIFRIEGIVGRQRRAWLHLMSEMISAAKLNGCAIVECTARLGWRHEIPYLLHTANHLEAII